MRRRQRREPVSYPAPELEPALRETYGVLLWQEQCIQVAVTAAGYTPGEGDQLRRAMSHKRSYERLEALTAELIARMTERGYSPRVAEAVRHMIVGFAGYGFPRSHAYAFAHLALISATLRLRYPAAYYAALLNCQPMGFYAPHTVLWDAHRHGIPVLPVDVNRSRWECTLEETAPGGATPPHTLRAGGLASGEEHQGAGAPGGGAGAGHPPRAQGSPGAGGRRPGDAGAGAGPGPLPHPARLRRPHRLRPRDPGASGRGGGLRLPRRGPAAPPAQPPQQPSRRRADVWATGELAGFGPAHLPGLAPQIAVPTPLPPMTEWEEVQADYRGTGFSIGRHVVSYFRPRLDRLGARRAAELPEGKRGVVTRAGGLVIVRQRPETASHLVFFTLEDETGLFNAIVYPQTYERLRRVLRGEPLIVLEGPLQVQDGIVHLRVRRAWSLTRDAATPSVPSHDFH